ncbi:MAG: hypothetical protein JXR52_11125 [Bacteroidales bacterium]|nr:hypothetical protein [Bacteroidales bacterium]MBN2699365.1 hypothetical protein [Bacteroidales bacterium]
MKNIQLFSKTIVLTAIAIILVTSCEEENNGENKSVDYGILIENNITANTTWKSGEVYILGGRITVVGGVTLTIEPGVIIKGQAGTGASATALLIARGATLIAEGTEADPIIFTSVADEIQPGDVASPNLIPELNGLWGGLLILGKAPISADAESVQIEGIPPTDPNGLYGGNIPNDNSGIIKYVSIRHGGANIGEGNEINGLTLGGVGSGTVIENIEVVANQDDGIEWFGGTVNVKNVVVWNTGDDAIDTDQGWAGTLDNFVVISPGDECFELDGGEGIWNATYTIRNGSVQASAGEIVSEGLADLDNKGAGDPGNSSVNMSNVYFFGLTPGQYFDDNPEELTLSAQAALPADSLALSDFFLKGSDAFVTEVEQGANTVGANLSKFQNWSWASLSGALNEF